MTVKDRILDTFGDVRGYKSGTYKGKERNFFDNIRRECGSILRPDDKPYHYYKCIAELCEKTVEDDNSESCKDFLLGEKWNMINDFMDMISSHHKMLKSHLDEIDKIKEKEDMK